MPYLTDPILSACIVLYHSPAEVLKTVQCLQDSDIMMDLFIVDNSPEDSVGNQIRWQCPGVTYLPQASNRGFGAGHNAVLPNLRSRYHLICNPDVTFSPNLLSRMVAFMEQHPDIAVLTPHVVNEDGSEQFLPKRHPTIRYLLGGRLEKRGSPFAEWRAEYTMANVGLTVPTSVEYATGCFMLVRTAYFRQLGGFNEKFFLYHEDSDLSRRMLRKGAIVYHPDMTICHAWARESTHSRKAIMHHIASTIRYFNLWGWKW